MTSTIITMVTRGDSAVWVQKIYTKFRAEPFTCKKILKRFPRFNRALLRAMHNANVIRLKNGNKRVTGISKTHPSVWVFSNEALMVLQRYYQDK